MQRLSMFIAGVALLASNVLFAAPAVTKHAAGKPDFSFRSEVLKASITIDPALKHFPGLYENLLAAGKRAVAKWNAEAEQDKKKYPETFRGHRRHEYDRAYNERSLVAGRFVSILRTQYIDAGGAHPNHDVNTILWDAKARKRISILPFFGETRTNGRTMRRLAKAIRAAVVAAKKARGMPPTEANDPMWLDGIKPDLTKIGGVALAPSTERGKSAGLIVYFSPYAVGSYAEGSYVVFVPWTVFRADLSREGRSVFGGRRPKDDRSDDSNG